MLRRSPPRTPETVGNVCWGRGVHLSAVATVSCPCSVITINHAPVANPTELRVTHKGHESRRTANWKREVRGSERGVMTKIHYSPVEGDPWLRVICANQTEENTFFPLSPSPPPNPPCQRGNLHFCPGNMDPRAGIEI